jgi:AcrR family transcriptional regulator
VTGPGRPTARRGAPRGELQVRAALVAAATDLFADRGPSAVTVREIADAARVNHGLVHHYFGSKDGLVTAVLEQLATQSAAALEREPTSALYAAGGAIERHGRILAHLLLEGRAIGDHKTGFPSMHALIDRYRRASDVSDADARTRVAQVAALVLGWQLFEPFLASAAGLDLTEATRSAVLDDAVDALLVRRR